MFFIDEGLESDSSIKFLDVGNEKEVKNRRTFRHSGERDEKRR